MKIQAKINKIENKHIIKRINKPELDSLKRLIKLVNYWQDLLRNKEMAQIINIRN